MLGSIKEDKERAYRRMLIGASIGILLSTLIGALLLWGGGWFQRVPMFTPPPGLILLLLAAIGAVIGALASLFSNKWHR